MDRGNDFKNHPANIGAWFRGVHLTAGRKVSMDGKCNIYPISNKVKRPQAKVKMDRND
jgi:hypothetical protein